MNVYQNVYHAGHVDLGNPGVANSHLIRRNGTYFFRVRMPRDLAVRFGRNEFRRSLKTADRRVAMRAKARIYLSMTEVFEIARAAPYATREELLMLLDQVALQEDTARLERELTETRGDLQAITSVAAGLARLRDAEPAIDRVALALDRLPSIAGQVGQIAAAGKLAASAGVIDQVRDLMASLGARPVRVEETPTITEFLDNTYLDEAKLRDDARRHMAHYVRLFARIIGDKRIAEIRRADVVGWVATLEKLKAGMGRSSKDAHKSIKQLIRESRGKPTLGRTTIEKHVIHVKAFLVAANRHYRFSTREEIEDLFVDIRFSAAVPAPKKRKIWSIEDLNSLFATPIWTGTRARIERPADRHQPGKRIHKDAYWWLPIVALHTGMRLEEIAQLRHEDLKKDKDGRPFLHLNAEDGRRLKTSNSHRDVPVHPVLIEIGFLDLFKSDRGSKPIFPLLKPSGRLKKHGELYTKHFGRYRKATGIWEPRRDFHSFRRTFVTTLRTRCGVDPLTVAALVGHDDGGEELKRVRQTNDYTDYSVEALAAALEKLNYEALGLDLSFARTGLKAAA